MFTVLFKMEFDLSLYLGADTKAKVIPSRGSSLKGLVHSNNAYQAVMVNIKAAIKMDLQFHVT